MTEPYDDDSRSTTDLSADYLMQKTLQFLSQPRPRRYEETQQDPQPRQRTSSRSLRQA